jgi:hypothetical protein
LETADRTKKFRANDKLSDLLHFILLAPLLSETSTLFLQQQLFAGIDKLETSNYYSTIPAFATPETLHYPIWPLSSFRRHLGSLVVGSWLAAARRAMAVAKKVTARKPEHKHQPM